MGPAGFQPAQSVAAVYLSRPSGTKADDVGYQGAAPSKPPTLLSGGLETAAPWSSGRMPEEASKMLALPSVFCNLLPKLEFENENEVTLHQENIFASVKRRPPYFLLAVLTACILIMFCTPLADQLILFPSTQHIDAHGATQQTVPFQNGELEIWTARSRLAQQRNHVDAYVLRFYGNADRAERWVVLEADAFGERAIEVWGMNYPGFGGSSGPARLARMSPASLAAFDALKPKAGNQPIFVFGASIGSAVAMDVAVNREVRGLVLHNPTPLRQVALRKYGWWNLWLLAGPIALQIPHELDSIANAKRIHAPAIFLLAENDEIVPPKFQRLVVDSFAGEKQVITLPGAYHNSPIEGPVVAEIHRAYDWLFGR